MVMDLFEFKFLCFLHLNDKQFLETMFWIEGVGININIIPEERIF